MNLGLGANVLLAVLKTGVGIVAHSPALLADGINSTSDVAYYVVVKVFMRLAGQPADREHPYGHSQLESIAALVVGAFVMTTGVTIFWDAINKVYDLLAGQGDFSGAGVLALAVALFTVALKVGLLVVTQRIARQTGSTAVSALAKDHRNDVFASAGAAIGIFLGRNGLPWVDPLAGALVALLVLRTGIQILRDAAADLMDDVPSHELAAEVGKTLLAVPGIECVEEVYAHRFGPYLVANVTIGIDGSLSVAAGDCIATQAERELFRSVDLLRRVHIHYHPVDGSRPLAVDDAPKSVNDLQDARVNDLS
ncbi:MAG: cation diffusion facilitator family transporter [Nitrososphaerales archaeon]